MVFPVEIWEIIFHYSEAVVLANLRIVSKTWKEIIDKTLEEKDHWYRQCVEDVPRQFWNIFYEKLNPEAEIDKIAVNDSKKWMTMYRSWITCKNVKTSNIDIGEFKPVPHRRHDITCIKVLNNLMAIGTNSGFLYLYNIYQLCEAPIFTADALEYIKSIQFVRNGSHIFIVSCSINDHVKYWDIELKKLIKKKRGRLMCANYYHLCMVMNNEFLIENLSTSSSTLSENRSYASHFIVLAAVLDNDMVIIYTQKGNYEKYLLDNPQVIYSSNYLAPPAFKVRRYYAFKPEILTYITDLGLMGFSVGANGWREYDVHFELDGTPTSIIIYDHLIILGLNIGNVHMYYFEDFEMLDFNPKNSKLISCDPSAIISMEIFFHEEEQYLAVAQSKKIHFLEFL